MFSGDDDVYSRMIVHWAQSNNKMLRSILSQGVKFARE